MINTAGLLAYIEKGHLEVKEPGSRGGKLYRTKRGTLRYGVKEPSDDRWQKLRGPRPPWQVSSEFAEYGYDKKRKGWYDHDDNPLPSWAAGYGIRPSWKNVRLNPDRNATVLAVGWDGTKFQYYMNPTFSAAQAVEKFNRIKDLTKAMPKLRAHVASDVKNKSLPKWESEAAQVVRLIDATAIRIGGDKEAASEGASTLKADHVTISADGKTAKLNFPAKNKLAEKVIADRAIVKELAARKAKGGKLFETNANAVRKYLKSRVGEYKVHDLRTWHATARALREIQGMPTPTTPQEYVAAQKRVVEVVAELLADTPRVAKSSYIDYGVWAKWQASAGVTEKIEDEPGLHIPAKRQPGRGEDVEDAVERDDDEGGGYDDD